MRASKLGTDLPATKVRLNIKPELIFCQRKYNAGIISARLSHHALEALSYFASYLIRHEGLSASTPIALPMPQQRCCGDDDDNV